jgi:phage shock protein C
VDKKLYRCRSGRIIFGVCCGLARYFDLDPVIVRLIFVLALFIPGLNGAAFLAYIVLAIIIPVEGSAATTTEQTVKENLSEMRDTASELGEKVRANLESENASREERIKRRSHALTLLGGSLIILGVLALLSSLNIFWWFRWEFLGPAVLIIIGILFLLSATKRR